MAPVAAKEDIEDIPVGEPVLVEGGLVVIKKPKECIRKVNSHETLLNNIINRVWLSRQLMETTFLSFTLEGIMMAKGKLSTKARLSILFSLELVKSYGHMIWACLACVKERPGHFLYLHP